MNEYKAKYLERKRKEFLEYIIPELNVTRGKLEELKNKLEKYLIEGGKLGKAWSYVIEEKENLIERINYMEKIFIKI